MMAKITLDHLIQLSDLQKELAEKGEDLYPQDIKRVLGTEDYKECRGNYPLMSDLLCIWADPKTKIIVYCLSKGNTYVDLEQYEVSFKQYNYAEFNEKLFELKYAMMNSQYAYEKTTVKGHFESLLA